MPVDTAVVEPTVVEDFIFEGYTGSERRRVIALPAERRVFGLPREMRVSPLPAEVRVFALQRERTP